MTNPTPVNWRALCAELVETLGEYQYRLEEAYQPDRPAADRLNASFHLLERARAALAQPEPQGPTDEELVDTYWCDKAWHEHLDGRNRVVHAAGLRAVLTRWGRPAIEPVPSSEENFNA